MQYQKIGAEVFFTQYSEVDFSYSLFELSLDWHKATYQYLTPECSTTYYHCLLNDNKELQVAWPLIHIVNKSSGSAELKSLTSFYSAIAEPIFMANVEQQHDVFFQLCQCVRDKNYWHKMTLGPFNDSGSLCKIIQDVFGYHRIYSIAANWYQSNIISAEKYIENRPSRLKNTIKRNRNKLLKNHEVNVKTVTNLIDFNQCFLQYQNIYQQSWKGEEGSYDFIQAVCQSALLQNKLRMGMLYVDDVAVATQLWFVEKHTASIFKLAYHPDYRQYSVGSILSMALSEHVIEHDKVNQIEFGMGNEPYKQEWMSAVQQRITLECFNVKTLKGFNANIKYRHLANIKQWLLALISRVKE